MAKHGFTLVEALVSVVILGITAVTIASMTTTSVRSLHIARDYQTAADLLDQTMTKIDLIGPDRLSHQGPTRGTFEAPYQRFNWEAKLSQRAEGFLWDVTLEVTWSDGQMTRVAQAHTLLNDEPNSHDPALRWDDL